MFDIFKKTPRFETVKNYIEKNKSEGDCDDHPDRFVVTIKRKDDGTVLMETEFKNLFLAGATDPNPELGDWRTASLYHSCEAERLKEAVIDCAQKIKPHRD